MRKGTIVPVFLPYAGCKQRCIFCDQYAATGLDHLPVIAELEALYNIWASRGGVEEVAFYGGTITGLSKKRLVEYLSWARSKLGGEGSIRISTRPDEIDEEIVSILKEFGVRHVEIGVQSFSDSVLEASNRGHSGNDAERAIRLLKSSGFIVGAHLMIGLPKSSIFDELHSAERLVELNVDTCRIHPTLVFKRTTLHRMVLQGHYTPLSLEEAVERTSAVYSLLKRSGVQVIRIGLFLEVSALDRLAAGPHHPSLGHMVKSLALYKATLELAENEDHIEVKYSKHYEPIVFGYKRQNLEKWKKAGMRLSLSSTPEEGILTVNGEDLRWVV